MPESIKIFENSLRDYLIDARSDKYNSNDKIQQKYNNLKVYMDPQRYSTPHFCVSVNISAATYSIEPLQRIAGSMGTDERFVLLWAARDNINGELRKHWNSLSDGVELLSETVINSMSGDSNAPLMKGESLGANEIMTGTGIRNKPKLKFEKISRLRRNRERKHENSKRTGRRTKRVND